MVVSAGLLLVACSAGTGSGSTGPARPLTLRGAEAHYGVRLAPSSSVAFQPDVVVVGGGADSVRSVSSDGLVWTIDAKAAHADEIATGKVIAITNLGAGRVLAVERDGDAERVAIGPIALTDLVKSGTLATDGPIALKGFQAVSTPDRPGLATDIEHGDSTANGSTGSGSGSGTATTEPAAVGRTPSRVVPAALSTGDVPAGLVIPARRTGTFPPPAKDIPPSQVADWHINSICCTAIGIHVSYAKDGAHVQGTAELNFQKPSLDFGVRIGGGHIVNARVQLSGAAGLRFGIAASVESSAANFHGGRIQLPVDIDIPLLVAGIPMTVGIQQIFSVSLGLGGKAELDTSGEYRLSGALGFHLVDGKPGVDLPKLTTTKSALRNVHSLAVAPSALTFAYAVKVSIGIGPPGFNAGLWYQVAASLGLATSGSQIDQLQGTSLVTCKTVSLGLQGRYGVGYTIPQLVADAINLFLKAVFRHPPAPVLPTGGPAWGPTTLFSQSTPPCSK